MSSLSCERNLKAIIAPGLSGNKLEILDQGQRAERYVQDVKTILARENFEG